MYFPRTADDDDGPLTGGDPISPNSSRFSFPWKCEFCSVDLCGYFVNSWFFFSYSNLFVSNIFPSNGQLSTFFNFLCVRYRREPSVPRKKRNRFVRFTEQYERHFAINARKKKGLSREYWLQALVYHCRTLLHLNYQHLTSLIKILNKHGIGSLVMREFVFL